MQDHGLGRHGENLAAEYLGTKGHIILARNYAALPVGEIDIVSRDPEGVLVFTEVKTMTGDGLPEKGIVPEDQAHRRKLERLYRMGQLFAAKHPEKVDERSGWRVDLLAISVPREPGRDILTYSLKDVIINEYGNI